MKIRKKDYKYSNYKDTEKMNKLNNFGNKCKLCKKELTIQESKKSNRLCNECEIV